MAVSRLRRVAANAPVPVFVARGGGSGLLPLELAADERLHLVATPRHASVLLAVGRFPGALGAALDRVHDQMPHPRGAVWWTADATGERPAALRPATVVAGGNAGVAETAVGVHRALLLGERVSAPDVGEDRPPHAFEGRGDYGQGGEGMMGGVPYGRPMAMTADDRDGLSLDQVSGTFGPFLFGLPNGLQVEAALQGGIVQDARLVALDLGDGPRLDRGRGAGRLTPPPVSLADRGAAARRARRARGPRRRPRAPTVGPGAPHRVRPARPAKRAARRVAWYRRRRRRGRARPARTSSFADRHRVPSSGSRTRGRDTDRAGLERRAGDDLESRSPDRPRARQVGDHAVSAHAAFWAAPVLCLAVLAAGAYVVGLVDDVAARLVAGHPLRVSTLGAPYRRVAATLASQPTTTERPDPVTWVIAPAGYVALAAAALAVVPWSSSFSIADVRAGVVWWGTVEALTIVVIFLHGWSANSHLPLLAAYRFVAVGLSYLLLSMFVLIAAAIPAESLALSRIVASQDGVWNVVRQPLGLPLFLVVALGASTWGPLDLADGEDLAGGTLAEVSGRPRLVWSAARAAMLTAFAAMAATVFLGGWQGPVLPGPLWVALKTVVVLVALTSTRHLFARVRAERFVVWCWVVLLPIAFVDLVIAGVEGLR